MDEYEARLRWKDEAFLLRADEKYIARCAGCGRELLKKKGVTLMARRSYANPKVIGYFCPACFEALADKYELKGI